MAILAIAGFGSLPIARASRNTKLEVSLRPLRLRHAAKLYHRHRRSAHLRHLSVPLLGHLVLYERARDALREQRVGLCLRLGLREDRLRSAGGADRVALRLEQLLLQLVL